MQASRRKQRERPLVNPTAERIHAEHGVAAVLHDRQLGTVTARGPASLVCAVWQAKGDLERARATSHTWRLEVEKRTSEMGLRRGGRPGEMQWIATLAVAPR